MPNYALILSTSLRSDLQCRTDRYQNGRPQSSQLASDIQCPKIKARLTDTTPVTRLASNYLALSSAVEREANLWNCFFEYLSLVPPHTGDNHYSAS